MIDMTLHDSWKILVYGRPRKRPPKGDKPVTLTSPVDWSSKPVRRQINRYFHLKPLPRQVPRHANVRSFKEPVRDYTFIPTRRYGEAEADLRDKRGDRHLFASKRT